MKEVARYQGNVQEGSDILVLQRSFFGTRFRGKAIHIRDINKILAPEALGQPGKMFRMDVERLSKLGRDSRGAPFMGDRHGPAVFGKMKHVAAVKIKQLPRQLQGMVDAFANALGRQPHKKTGNVGYRLFKQELVMEGFFRAFALGDIPGERQDFLLAAITDLARGNFHRKHGAVLADVHGFKGCGLTGAPGFPTLQNFGPERSVPVQIEYVHPEHLIPGIAGLPQGRMVDIEKPAFEIVQVDHVDGLLHQGAVFFFAFEQLLFGLFAFRDILGKNAHADYGGFQRVLR